MSHTCALHALISGQYLVMENKEENFLQSLKIHKFHKNKNLYPYKFKSSKILPYTYQLSG